MGSNTAPEWGKMTVIRMQHTRAPLRSTVAVSDKESFKASKAASAFDSCHTPTMALRIRMSKITAGSMNALMPSSALPSSKSAKQKDITAASSKTCVAALASEPAKTHEAQLENVPGMKRREDDAGAHLDEHVVKLLQYQLP